MATTTGDTINGPFGALDFTALPYSTGTAANFNATNGVLTVTTGSEYESLTLNNPGAASYKVSSDGKLGTDVAGAGSGTIGIGNTPAGANTTPSPGDTVVQIALNNAQLSASKNVVGTLSGSVNVDYTKGTTQGILTFTSSGQTEIFADPYVAATSPVIISFMDQVTIVVTMMSVSTSMDRSRPAQRQ